MQTYTWKNEFTVIMDMDTPTVLYFMRLETVTYSVGWNTTERTLFLWLVKVHLDFPAAKSHNRMVQS